MAANSKGRMLNVINSSRFGEKEPANLLKEFEFQLLKCEDLYTRKAALLALFFIIKAGNKLAKTHVQNTKFSRNVSKALIQAPLLIKNGVAFLGIMEDGAGLFHLINSANNSIKNRIHQLQDPLFAFSPRNGFGEVFLGVDYELVLNSTDDFDSLVAKVRDPRECTFFAKIDTYWEVEVELVYMRIGGGEEFLPSCSSSDESSDNDAESDDEYFNADKNDAPKYNKPQSRSSSIKIHPRAKISTFKSEIRKVSNAETVDTIETPQSIPIEKPKIESKMTDSCFIIRSKNVKVKYFSSSMSPKKPERVKQTFANEQLNTCLGPHSKLLKVVKAPVGNLDRLLFAEYTRPGKKAPVAATNHHPRTFFQMKAIHQDNKTISVKRTEY